MAITPNPVTAFRKSGKTPPKPPNLEGNLKVYGKQYGTISHQDLLSKPKTTTHRRRAKVLTAAQDTSSAN
jgi:hypothetical protein